MEPLSKRGGLRCALMVCGVPYVTVDGMQLMLMCCVDHLVTVDKVLSALVSFIRVIIMNRTNHILVFKVWSCYWTSSMEEC